MISTDQPTATRRSRLPLIVVAILLALLAAAALHGISTRAKALAAVTHETEELAVPTLSTVTPTRGAPTEEITLPGNVQPYVEAPIYARTNGYLKRWRADIGTHVATGQLLAEIDTPELDQQIQQARADLATAEANAKLAQTTAERYRELITTDSVSQQDLDNANGGLEAKLAAVESAKFNVKRLEELQGFSHVEAPFAGVITARNVDVGALIGSSGKELFHIASTDRLRVFVNVPQIYSQAARPGLTATLTLKEFPGRQFTGTLARTSSAIDVATRTLLAEVDVDNRKGELLPGSYAEVHLKLPASQPTLKLPATSLIFKSDGLQVATVNSDNRVTLVPITVGRDFGDSMEIVSGLSGSERVIANPPDSLTSGEIVRVVNAEE
jgi:RND family efflux transporter MFP subunit